MPPEAVAARIGAAKARLGSRLVILGHHYQRDEIIRWADFRGDSFKLSQQADRSSRGGLHRVLRRALHGESADILAADHQHVILPNMAAGCSMADMADRGSGARLLGGSSTRSSGAARIVPPSCRSRT